MDRQTDRQKDRQTHRQTERKTKVEIQNLRGEQGICGVSVFVEEVLVFSLGAETPLRVRTENLFLGRHGTLPAITTGSWIVCATEANLPFSYRDIRGGGRLYDKGKGTLRMYIYWYNFSIHLSFTSALLNL